jgi:hypothetical protein
MYKTMRFLYSVRPKFFARAKLMRELTRDRRRGARPPPLGRRR